MLRLDDAIKMLRQNPQYSDLVRDSYLERDVQVSADRFWQSAEFDEVRKLLGAKLQGSLIVDLGAGIGIAANAFIKAGARRVYAIEPDLSDEVGCKGLKRLRGTDTSIQIISAIGEDIPLPDQSVDIVYTRQVLHHTHDLPRVLCETTRCLKPGGLFLACREHVVDNEQQLEIFLKNHPIHQLAGGENAYRLDEYLGAISKARLRLERLIAPWDSVINAFPGVRSQAELENFPRIVLHQKLGILGDLISFVPVTRSLVWKRIMRPTPGRMYSFLAIKP